MLQVNVSLFRDIHNSLTVSNIWKVSIEKPGSLELMRFLAKLVCKKIYLIECSNVIGGYFGVKQNTTRCTFNVSSVV